VWPEQFSALIRGNSVDVVDVRVQHDAREVRHVTAGTGAPAAVRLSRSFTTFWAAAATSGMGDGIVLAAAPLIASRLTGDPRLIAGVTMALTLPYVLFGIPMGVLVDRLDRRRSMIVIDFVRAGVLGLFTLGILSGHAGLVALYACFFLVGTGETFFRNASQALVPDLVTRDALVTANSRLVATQAATQQFIGPLAGSALFVVAPVLPFGVDAVSFLLSALLLRKVRPHREQVRAAAPAPGHRLRGLMRDMATGAKWLWRHRLLRNLAAISGVLNFVGAGAMAVMVVYAHRSLHLSDFGYGVLLTAEAVGSVLAAPLAPALVSRIGRDRALVLVAALYALANLGLSFFPVWWVAATGFLVIACGSVTWDVVVVALRQTLIPSELQGRVNSVYRLVAWGAIPLGAAVAGPISYGFGPPAVYGFGAGVMLLVMIRVAAGARRRWITTTLQRESDRDG
jgi:MFS family permease